MGTNAEGRSGRTGGHICLRARWSGNEFAYQAHQVSISEGSTARHLRPHGHERDAELAGEVIRRLYLR
jgi:hypothetical protein